jgi:probable phosphoglycerate mutase
MSSESVTCSLLRAPFYFLRHGETEANRLGLIAGQTDIPLNETGWRQARTAAGLLEGCGIGAIYSSPLRRARDTAQCVAERLGLEVVVLDGLAERNWGELEGRPRSSRPRGLTPPGGESLEAFTHRTLAALAAIPAGGVPLVVAHSGTFRVLCAQLGIPAPQAPVANSTPLRFVPPVPGGAVGSVEPVERASGSI